MVVADGVNDIKSNTKARVLLRRHICPRLKVVTVSSHQGGLDHCGSPAVMIGLEFLRLMKQGDLVRPLVFSRILHQKLIKKMHPLPSAGSLGGLNNSKFVLKMHLL